jgi:MFS family permease
LWTGVPLPVIYILTVLQATGATFFSPTRYAVVPDIVPRRDLLRANTLDETTQSALDPVAYLIGGSLVALMGVRAAFGIDTLTFLLSALLIAMTTPRAAAKWRAERDVRRPVQIEAAEGVRLLFCDPLLRANMALMLVAGLIASADTPLVYMLAFSHWKRGAFGLGILEAALAIGFVLGAFVCGPTVDRLGKGYAILLGLLGTGVSMGLMAVLPFWPAVLVNGVSGVCNILFFVPSITLTQERAPRSARARVLSSRAALMSVSIFASYALATALTPLLGPQVLMFAAGAALYVVAVAAMAVPALRQR